MLADITRLDLRLRRRSAIGYSAGMALYTLIVVALYPSFKNSASLDSLSGSTAAALFGVTGKLTSPGGWLNGNIYGNFVPLIMLLLTIGYGAAALAGQDEDGTLALIAALPVRRQTIVFQKACAMAVQALLLATAVTVCVLIGRKFQLTVSAGDAVAISVALMLLGLDFGLIAMAIGAAAGRRGTALGVASGLAAASYLLSSLAPAIPAIRPGRYLSLFYWSVGDDQVNRGVSPGDFTVLIAVGLCALAASVAVFGNADLNG
jgi:ABC-2 type transport system permease protein